VLLTQRHLLVHRHLADIGAHPRAAALDLAAADDQLLLDDRDHLLGPAPTAPLPSL
jgi:hypothetical protein